MKLNGQKANANSQNMSVDQRINLIRKEVQEGQESGIIRLNKDYLDKVFLLGQVDELADHLVELSQRAGQIAQVAQGLQGNSERMRQEIERLREIIGGVWQAVDDPTLDLETTVGRVYKLVKTETPKGPNNTTGGETN